ncbi:MAG: ribonuclease III [Hyphomicrobiales bacterium]|nr:ribonuclease III [Hyphomicrobiales bacterium]PCJ90097.1 MAG: ribonuclease III [Hyphomicrobiales bacterium]
METVAQRLGHEFNNLLLLKHALTHMSAVGDDRTLQSYQRLEFQGDRVMALVVTDMLMQEFPIAEEGELARRLTALVRNETCVEIARELELGDDIYLGSGEAGSGGRKKKAILGDVCESVIAAVYVDGGFPAAQKFVRRFWQPKMHRYDQAQRDSKTELQEWAQSQSLAVPEYGIVRRMGPDHAPEFLVEVNVKGYAAMRAAGGSKRSAEHAAAYRMLLREGVIEAENDDE